jgi:predicted nucleic acid-binding protein
MTLAYFADSSALVKLYADEFGAEAVRALPLVVVSQLARVEVPAALWRKHRRGELAAADTATLIAEFEADFFGDGSQPPRFSVIAVTPAILEHAAHLVGVHGLRAYDSVQLASACATSDAVAEGVGFAAFDKALCDAAAVQGLALLPPD